MGVRQSKPNYTRTRIRRPINPPYNQVAQQAVQQQVQQPIYDTMGGVLGQKSVPMVPTTQPIIYQPDPNEYLDVVGSDSGNMTVFSWITQLSTCCSSLCTLIVLISFVVWMFLNRSINTLP